MFTTYGLHGSKPYIAYDLDAVIYTDIKGALCIATNESIFDFWTEYAYAERKGISLLQVPIGYRYSIDNIEVTEQTFNDVRRLLSERNLVKKYESVRKKENEDMPKIVDYKYNEETGTTTLFWADKTQTTVTADNLTEANQFEGFCAACAKKLFGNRSTYLNQFDKWTVKIPERERLAAEKKAAEDKAHEEAKARKAAKKAERRRKREVELLARGFAENYNNNSVYEQAKKLAMKKYGVPANYFDESCDCHCNCKEFDVMDEDENNISD